MKFLRFILLPGLVLIIAVAVAGGVIATRPRAVQESPSNAGVLVEVTAVERQPRRIDVEAKGIVVPAQQVVVQPSGRRSHRMGSSGAFPGHDSAPRRLHLLDRACRL